MATNSAMIMQSEGILTLKLLRWLISPLQNDTKIRKMTETLAHGYSSENTQQELSNE